MGHHKCGSARTNSTYRADCAILTHKVIVDYPDHFDYFYKPFNFIPEDMHACARVSVYTIDFYNYMCYSFEIKEYNKGEYAAFIDYKELFGGDPR